MAAPSLSTPSTAEVVPTSTPAARALFARLWDSVRLGLSQRRPWAELIDRSSFARPQSLAEATGRLRKNWGYFRVNYMVSLSAVTALFLVMHPLSLTLLLTLLGAWVFLYFFRTEPLVLFGRTYSEREVFALMVVLSVIIVFLTDVGSLLISAVVVGLGLVAAHGAFRVPDDLFLDEQEYTGGFLSFLGTAARPSITSQV